MRLDLEDSVVREKLFVQWKVLESSVDCHSQVPQPTLLSSQLENRTRIITIPLSNASLVSYDHPSTTCLIYILSSYRPGLCQGRTRCTLTVGHRVLLGPAASTPCQAPPTTRGLSVEFKCRPSSFTSRFHAYLHNPSLLFTRQSLVVHFLFQGCLPW